MMTRLVIVVWLAIVWAALWGDVDAGNLVAGAGLGVLLVLLFPPDRRFRVVVRPLAFVRLLVVFAWRLLEASAVVVWEVVTPQNRINEGIIAVPVVGSSDFVTTVVANAVSLTPGTLTLEIDRSGKTLYVHVLHLHDVEEVRREIQALEELVIRAIGDREAVSRLGELTRGRREEPSS